VISEHVRIHAIPALQTGRSETAINFKSALRLTILLCLALSISHVAAIAQSAFGSISGTVTDPSGAAIPGAHVTVTNEATSTQQSTETKGAGEFVFPSLLPATYTVTAEKNGFKKLEKTGAVLVASQRLSVGVFQLSVGSTTAEVTISAEGTPIETTSSQVESTLSQTEIAALPSLGRDYMALLATLPGSNYVGEGNASPSFTSTSISFNGQKGGSVGNGTYISTNGVNSSWLEGSQDAAPSDLDTIQDIHVLQANYDAEYGRVSGSVLNITTRSGTSQFHGGLFYYFRNEDLNANDYFNKRNGQPRARYRFNTIGGTFGGPVLLPGRFKPLSQKLFFFASFDDAPSTVPNGARFYTMPTALERQGNFSQSYIPGSTTLYTVKNPATGQQFPGNIVPSTSIDPTMQTILNKVFPAPNFTNTAVSNGNYNYVISDSSVNPTDRVSLRFDYTPVSKLQVYGRWTRLGSGSTSRTSPGLLVGWQNGAENYANGTQRVEAGATYTITRNLVNQVSGGYEGWWEQLKTGPSAYGQFQSQNVLGGPFPNPYPDENPLGLLPGMNFNIVNAADFTYEPRYPLNDYYHVYSISDGLTYLVGNHQLKFGVYSDIEVSYQPHHTGQWGNAGSGDFNFNSPNPNNPNDAGNPWAEALMGDYDTYTAATNRVNLNMVQRDFEFYGQDSWKVTKKLTLNYGLRFTVDLPVVNANQFGSQIDFSQYNPADAPPLFQPVLVNGQPMTRNPLTGAIEPAAYLDSFVPNVGNPAPGSVSIANKSLTNSNGVLVAPRLGFAYDPFGDGKTAIRGGFGQFFAPRTEWGQVYGDVTNAPTVFYPTQYYGKVEQIAGQSGLLNPSVMQYINRSGSSPYTLQWTFGIQRELGYKTVLNTSYVANVGHHLQYTYNMNEVPYGAEFLAQNQNATSGTPLPDDYFRPYPGYNSITNVNFENSTNYNSLQVSLTRQFSKNLTFDGAYTWSKTLSDNLANTYLPTSLTYGPVIGVNRPNRLTADWVWSLPKASRLWSNWLSRSVLDNWSFSGIASFITGASDMVGAPGNSGGCSPSNGENITGGGDGYKCLKSGDAVLSKGNRTFNRYFNTSVFALPESVAAGAAPGSVANVGNQWNASFYDPGVENWDFSFIKKISFVEKVNGELRGDMFNAFNHPQFSAVNTSASFDPTTGAQLNTGFGQLTSDNQGPRVVQLSMRVSF
jgi:hypothetical protein